ncbi:unnamed protein product [Zymoseptoria tritici ST99CH_1A5]|uniref:Cytochrome P450 alkane hydroxylase n=1 Tax=Zymoseptoria tritici ST99CH_1A5 TaxID=1276529 RepID=A0A1Y6LY07_ZYMTR|nr:unnamed protein product [Zymoseptoria tritici ST99CH_1A5]
MAPHATLLLCTTLALLGYATWVHIKYRLDCRQFARAHGCKPTPKSYGTSVILGLDTLPDLIRAIRQHRLLDLGCEVFERYGHTFSATELGRDHIVTIDPDNIKTVLSLQFKDYAVGYRLDAFRPLLGESVFDTDGEAWARSRALIRPSFARDQIADLTSLESLFQDLLALLPRDGKTVVDLQPMFYRYTLDSACDFLFGRSAGTLRGEHSGTDFESAFEYAKQAMLVRGTIGRLSMLYRDRKAEKAYRTCRDFAGQFVDEAIRKASGSGTTAEHDSSKRIFSHELAVRTTSRKVVLDECMSLLLAGRDTTASLLGNLFFMLAKNPAIWDKIREEVAFLDGRPPSYDELRQLRYVQRCVNESLRLHPVIPRNERQAVRHTVLPNGGGIDGCSPVFVARGRVVAWNIHAMHRRKDIYGPDADDFRPERWENEELRPQWAYLPFNGGPRICIGQQYALTEAGYGLVRMAQEFSVLKSEDDGPWVESLAITVFPRNGVKVSLTPA